MVSYLRKWVGSFRRKRSLRLNERYPQYEFGKGTYSRNLKVYSWNEGATLRIGSYCSLADDIRIYLGGEHNVDWVTTYPFNVLWKAGEHIPGHPKTKGDVVIGSDVWIGREAMILSGVNIGDGAVVGARALVVKDVEPYAVVAGNPAHIIKKRFDDKTVLKLLEIRWWDWEPPRIEKALPLLLSSEMDNFLRAFEKGEI